MSDTRRSRKTDKRAKDDAGWKSTIKRTASEFMKDNLTDWAAALTYYGVLALFPALIVLVSIIGLVGESATQPLIDNLAKIAPGPAQTILTDAINNLEKTRGAAGVLIIVGLAGAFWSASGYIGAFMRASNSIYGVEEGRPIWKTTPLRLGLTLVTLILLAVSALAVTFTGGLAKQLGSLLGVGTSVVEIWDIVKWPVLVLVISFMFSLIYWAAPNVKQPGFKLLTPGGLLAVLLWIVASLGFAFYVGNFGSYNATYGALGGVVVFLLWLWISNLALLIGAEFNSEVERGRLSESGQSPNKEPVLEPRDPPN